MTLPEPDLAPAAPRPGSASALRLLPAPDSDPPYDDEGPRRRLRMAPAPQPVPVAPVLRLVPAVPAPPDRGDPPPEPLAARTPTSAMPPVLPAARAFVQRLLETSAGVRPVRQLQRDTSPELFAQLEAELAGRTAAARRPTPRDVRSVHVQERPEGVVEVCATVHREHGGTQRAGAMALRLEGQLGRWICTALVGI